MSEHSKIEWTDATWNPVRGCVKISAGCKNCYAATFAERFRDVTAHPYEHGFDPRLVPSKLLEPVNWATPKTVFVNSMSDLFQDAVPDEYIVAVATVMLRANWHTYQVLTKRAERLRYLLGTKLRDAAAARHIWWGVSVENRRDGVPRIEQLRRAPASVRFLSVEPLLEDLGTIELKDIDWVIAGGESGPRARVMAPAWAQAVREQCEAQGVLFFFKQWGGVQKGKAGRMLDGRTYDDMPPQVSAEVPRRSERDELARELSPLTNAWQSTPLIRLTHKGVRVA